MNFDAVVTFIVTGTPVPQGSKTIMRKGFKAWLVDSNSRKLKPWRNAVARAAAAQGVHFDEPVTVYVTFFLPEPKRPKWRLPAVKPDVDKLQRALSDGLADGGLIANDSRITDYHASKRYENTRFKPSALVTVLPTVLDKRNDLSTPSTEMGDKGNKHV